MATNQKGAAARIDRWVWVLVYGGLFGVIVGLAVGRADAGLGWTIGLAGAVLAVTGIVLIVFRSRLKR